MHQDAANVPIGIVFRDVNGQAVGRVCESPLAHERVHEVRADLEYPVLHFAHAGWHDHEIGDIGRNRRQNSHGQNRPDDRPAIETCSPDDDELILDV